MRQRLSRLMGRVSMISTLLPTFVSFFSSWAWTTVFLLLTFWERGWGGLQGIVTLIDLSPERLVTKPIRALRLLRESGVIVDMAWDAGAWGVLVAAGGAA